MREIKFQLIWKHESKVAKEVVSLDYLLESNPKAPRFTKGKLRVAAELVAKRQYTGLKDKNGVEIYEGDVINADFEGEYCPAVVAFEDGAFRLSYPEWDATLKKPRITSIDIDCLNYAVIGNIHQNPELLEK